MAENFSTSAGSTDAVLRAGADMGEDYHVSKKHIRHHPLYAGDPSSFQKDGLPGQAGQ
jgi:hypothetical protein